MTDWLLVVIASELLGIAIGLGNINRLLRASKKYRETGLW
jgi:hypothetical protein